MHWCNAGCNSDDGLSQQTVAQAMWLASQAIHWDWEFRSCYGSWIRTAPQADQTYASLSETFRSLAVYSLSRLASCC